MRCLLLGLLPIACTISAADPAPKNQIAPSKIAAPRVAAPIIERGEGCRQGIAADADGDGAGDEADMEAAPSGRAMRGSGGAMPADPAPRAKPAKRMADMDRDEAGGMPPPRPRMPTSTSTTAIARPAIQQQPSGVRAGEWDDNANYRDYARWLAETGKGTARLDIGSRQFLVVSDKDGKPVPNCSITVKGAHGMASLVTMASGRALMFPKAFGLDGDLTATAACAQTSTSATLALTGTDGVMQLKLGTARSMPARRTIDLAFVLDTTGSMAEEIEAVKQTIRAVADQLGTEQTDVRIGLVEYKDRTDCLLTRTFPFSSDLKAFSASVANIRASGGGDTPEDMHAGLSAALDKLEWRKDAVTRMVVVIADAPPHLDYKNERDYANAAKRAAGRGIKLFSVSASGMDDTGQVVMRQMAQFTGGSNLFVLRGGAGPQSVGGGDPKSSCGGTHNDYSSGKLDQLIIGKVKSELASIDADPMRIPGRGKDENAKPCDQRLVVAN